ncbi:MAG: hypothetical protein ACFFCZ_08220 [Promethearchaeota archaeon]
MKEYRLEVMPNSANELINVENLRQRITAMGQTGWNLEHVFKENKHEFHLFFARELHEA